MSSENEDLPMVRAIKDDVNSPEDDVVIVKGVNLSDPHLSTFQSMSIAKQPLKEGMMFSSSRSGSPPLRTFHN